MKESIKNKVKDDIVKIYLCNNLKLLLESSQVGYKDIAKISDLLDRVDNYEKYKQQEEKSDEEIIEDVLSKFKR